MKTLKLVTLVALLGSQLLLADPSDDEKTYKEQNWGIGAVYRTGSIPYVTEDSTVSSLVPMLFFENDYIFLHGLESGIKLYESDDWRVSAITRMHFVDIPEEYQNILQADTNDVGFQLQYKMKHNQFIDLEGMNDLHGRLFSNLRYSAHFENASLEYKPYAQLQWNTSKYNSYYYGLNQENIDSGIDAVIGVEARYHVWSNLYLLAKAQARFLGQEARDSQYIEDDIDAELHLGIGFFNDKNKPEKENLDISPYWRLAHGWATPSNLNDIITGNTEKDPYNNQFTSIFYGYPLADEIFGFPLDFYLTPGFVFHHSSDVQDTTQEYVLAIKAYYTIPFPWKVRFGVAEGISYVDEVTYIEQTEMDEKGYRSSQLLNYLDFSLDLHLGDVFGEKLDDMWLGYSIHHRSAIFESSSRFGRIKGGSNYNSVYVQWHY
ncbi:MipA/OmpV family protein [Sulfurovum sp.]|uniref:MipA/OmpV family protein n=1 Tax=Sulfurovum sp. TaxID=1969726 RepID=UPI002867CBC1|nr:MipA/OmpV family protein [Sulfurovum sp.]